MGNLRSFVREKNAIPEEKKELANSLGEQMKQYEGKSEGELTNELKKQVDLAKADGTFSPQAMEQFAARVGPMLNEEQREKMQQLMKMMNEH